MEFHSLAVLLKLFVNSFNISENTPLFQDQIIQIHAQAYR
jgi:hypothetical protein